MGEKNISGGYGYGNLTAQITCEKIVMNVCKVPKRLAAVRYKLNKNYIS